MPGFHKGACAKPQNYANGGFVPKSKREGVIRGPGTGTSDSIQKEIPEGSYIMPADSTQQIGDQALSGLGKSVTAHVSNGEYQIPPEQVHAIGVQTLDRLKSATHTPVPEPRGFKPDLFFADGGLVDEEAQRRAAQASGMPAPPTPTISGYGGTAVRSAAPAATAPNPTPASSSAPASPGIMARTMPGTTNVWNHSGDAISAAYKKGGVPAAAAETTRAALAYPIAVYDDVVGQPRRMAVSGLTKFGKTLFTGDASPVSYGSGSSPTNPTSSSKPAQDPAKPASPAVAPPSTPAHSTTPPASSVPIKAGGGESAQDQTSLPNNIIKEGKNSYSGVNIGPDATLNGKPFGSASGTVSTLDNAAMQTLSDRYALQDMARGAALAQAQTQPLSAGFHPNTGLADERLTDGKQSELISLASTPMKGSQNGQLTANQLRVLADIQNQDANRVTASANASMHDALSRDLNAQNNAASAQRALLSETGANQRFAATNALDQQKVKLAQESQGFQTRALKRQEDLTAKWEAAQTPEEKSAIAQQIRALSGKSDAGVWKPVVLQGGTDAMGNRTESVMAAVNEATGEMRRYDQQAANAKGGIPSPKTEEEYNALPKGTQYMKDGQTRIKG